MKLAGRAYTELKRKKLEAQASECGDCGRILRIGQSHLHHRSGRGMGGGKRDDLDTILLCEHCHMFERHR